MTKTTKRKPVTRQQTINKRMAPRTTPVFLTSIRELLARMANDARAIETQLQGAALNLIGSKEHNLWEVVQLIKTDVAAAQKVWQ